MKNNLVSDLSEKNISLNNIEIAERFLRAATGFFVILYFLQLPVYPQLFAFIYFISLYLLLSALIAWDPLYALFYRVVILIDNFIDRKNHEAHHKIQLSV